MSFQSSQEDDQSYFKFLEKANAPLTSGDENIHGKSASCARPLAIAPEERKQDYYTLIPDLLKESKIFYDVSEGDSMWEPVLIGCPSKITFSKVKDQNDETGSIHNIGDNEGHENDDIFGFKIETLEKVIHAPSSSIEVLSRHDFDPQNQSVEVFKLVQKAAAALGTSHSSDKSANTSFPSSTTSEPRVFTVNIDRVRRMYYVVTLDRSGTKLVGMRVLSIES